MDKLTFYFSSNTQLHMRRYVEQTLSIKEVTDPRKYLGLQRSGGDLKGKHWPSYEKQNGNNI